MTLEYVHFYFVGFLNKLGGFIQQSHVYVEIGILGGVMLRTVHLRIIVCPRYLQETLFITMLSLYITINSFTIIENIDIIHNMIAILTNTIHSLNKCQFLLLFLKVFLHEGKIVEAHIKC